MTQVADHVFVPMEGTEACGRNVWLGNYMTACFFPREFHRAPTELERKTELIEMAWGIIANAGGGDWTKETEQWQEAAHRWGIQAGYRMQNN